MALVEGLRVVDADSHLTERHDLFTERAPKGYEERVPHVEHIDGVDMWVIEGTTFGQAGSGGTVDHEGKKHPFLDSLGGSWGIADGHPAAWDPADATPTTGMEESLAQVSQSLEAMIAAPAAAETEAVEPDDAGISTSAGTAALPAGWLDGQLDDEQAIEVMRQERSRAMAAAELASAHAAELASANAAELAEQEARQAADEATERLAAEQAVAEQAAAAAAAAAQRASANERAAG